jgi:DNA helicase-2/ATP-dependent DNA helicase PcrA
MKTPPIEHFWKLRSFTPTKEQQQAILHFKGPLFLTAGPGSGKTRVLLWRTLNLLVYQDVKPEEIFLSTFTEKAALQLKDGLRSLLASVTNATGRPFDISGMALGTVHSICNSIISDRRFTDDGQRKHPPNVMDELSQYFFLYNRNRWIELIDGLGFKNEEDSQRSINMFIANRNSSSRHEAVQNTLKLFNRLSEEMLDVKKFKKGDEVLLRMLKMYEKYRQMFQPQANLYFPMKLNSNCSLRYKR